MINPWIKLIEENRRRAKAEKEEDEKRQKKKMVRKIVDQIVRMKWQQRNGSKTRP